MRTLAMAMLCLLGACGAPDLKEELTRLRAPTLGLHDRTSAQFAATSHMDSAEPFESKEETLRWLSVLATYQPIPQESFIATQLISNEGAQTLDPSWLDEHVPEQGTLVPPLTITKKAVLSARAYAFDAAEWTSVRRAVLAYVEHASAGPIDTFVVIALIHTLNRVVEPTELGASEAQLKQSALLMEDARLLVSNWAVDKRQTGTEGHHDTVSMLQAAETVRHRLRVMLGML